ncbi:MAG: hypothetical protein QT05_C0041G0003 [archaeon GW2011_AR13]|nr:MAG: hypothetical protein QT05_C0041G0003 [archaeon GW2011_AR13]
MVREIKPHIQLENFSHGLFPNERIGSFKDYHGEKQFLELQTCNSNFTRWLIPILYDMIKMIFHMLWMLIMKFII